ncbi:hypothetical protein BDD12DRAFT_983751 [Trichophaea hybrida]|nr:hypothetical protein BDD12DRAFT_983751 [Trichophaea hybrida]
MDQSISSPLYNGWESFPNNLNTYTPYRLDAIACNQHLSNEASRLFSPNEGQLIRVLHSDGDPKTLKNLQELEKYLQEYQNFRGKRIFLIPQQYSWGELMISEEAMRKLFTSIGVFAEFVDLVHAFGSKTGPVDETFASGPVYRANTDSKSFELCYLAKLVEHNGKSEKGVSDFSIRQMALYHGFDGPNDSHTFIILNPSLTFQTHFKQARSRDGGLRAMDWQDLHLAAVYSMSFRWREYVNYLEAQFGRKLQQTKSLMDPKRHFSTRNDTIVGDITNLRKSPSVEVKEEDEARDQNSVSFTDIQKLQMFKDRSLFVYHVLRLNLGVFQGLERVVTLRQRIEKGQLPDTACTNEDPAPLSAFISDTVVQGQRVDHLLRRIEGASTLFRTILDFRALETARRDSELIVGISKDTQRDARALKTITLLTLVYLPATFVATLLSMGYIRIKSERGHVVFEFANELWIFGILTTVMLVATLGPQAYMQRRRSKREKEDEKQIPEKALCDMI